MKRNFSKFVCEKNALIFLLNLEQRPANEIREERRRALRDIEVANDVLDMVVRRFPLLDIGFIKLNCENWMKNI